MLKLKDVYALPGTPIDITWGVRGCWFPEASGAGGELIESEVGEEMNKEGRLVIRCVFEKNFDGDRFADMHTVWFDGKPIMIVRDGGRSGKDHRSRFITDDAGYLAACLYIRHKQRITVEGYEDDVTDPEMTIYPEAMFNFYGGTDFAAQLGFSVEPKTEGFRLYPDLKRLLPSAPADHILVEGQTSVGEMPEYLRRGGYVMRRVRPLTPEELAENPRIVEFGHPEGFTLHYLYIQAEAPAGATIIKM